MATDPADLLRQRGIQITAQRLAVLRVVSGQPHITADVVADHAHSPAALRELCAHLEEAGVTEVAYQPAGPDIPRELEAFATAVRG